MVYGKKEGGVKRGRVQKRVESNGVRPKGRNQRGGVQKRVESKGVRLKKKRKLCMVLLVLPLFAAFVLGKKIEQNFTLRTLVSYWKTGKRAVF